MMDSVDFLLRDWMDLDDIEEIGRLCRAAGNFRAEEVNVAQELGLEWLAQKEKSGYHFLLAEHSKRVCGFICYGPVPCTRWSWDVYWIVVDPAWQGRGVGRALIQEAEARILKMGGARIYIETSSQDNYQGSRAFYSHLGFNRQTSIPDFYGPGDGKVIYVKIDVTSGPGDLDEQKPNVKVKEMTDV